MGPHRVHALAHSAPPASGARSRRLARLEPHQQECRHDERDGVQAERGSHADAGDQAAGRGSKHDLRKHGDCPQSRVGVDKLALTLADNLREHRRRGAGLKASDPTDNPNATR